MVEAPVFDTALFVETLYHSLKHYEYKKHHYDVNFRK